MPEPDQCALNVFGALPRDLVSMSQSKGLAGRRIAHRLWKLDADSEKHVDIELGPDLEMQAGPTAGTASVAVSGSLRWALNHFASSKPGAAAFVSYVVTALEP
ncbi:hypothetical protein F5887DRAFT_1087573 [Amanita rubescens]|nr:hypothetical protein F5887DRAFT_1087573 [Amanita rubescens]